MYKFNYWLSIEYQRAKKTSEKSVVQGVVPLYAISGRSAKIFSDLVFCPNWGIYSRQLSDGNFLDNRY